MLNREASLAISIRVLKALPGKLDIKDTHSVFSIIAKTRDVNKRSQSPDIKRHSPSILYIMR